MFTMIGQIDHRNTRASDHVDVHAQVSQVHEIIGDGSSNCVRGSEGLVVGQAAIEQDELLRPGRIAGGDNFLKRCTTQRQVAALRPRIAAALEAYPIGY